MSTQLDFSLITAMLQPGPIISALLGVGALLVAILVLQLGIGFLLGMVFGDLRRQRRRSRPSKNYAVRIAPHSHFFARPPRRWWWR